MFVLSDGSLRNQNGDFVFFVAETNVNIVARNKQAVFVVVFGVDGDGCGVGINFVVVETRFEVVDQDLAVGKHQFGFD